MPDFKPILVEAAKLAAEVMLKSGRKINIKFEGVGSADIVTEADKAVESALRSFFKDKLPDYNILGEEFGGSYNGNGKVIHLDPIDDTRHSASTGRTSAQ
jgi:myo-inositol-1(or 4)-monophosphatase